MFIQDHLPGRESVQFRGWGCRSGEGKLFRKGQSPHAGKDAQFWPRSKILGGLCAYQSVWRFNVACFVLFNINLKLSVKGICLPKYYSYLSFQSLILYATHNSWRQGLSMPISHNGWMELPYPDVAYVWIPVASGRGTSAGGLLGLCLAFQSRWLAAVWCRTPDLPCCVPSAALFLFPYKTADAVTE